ncbi:MAG: c-type cytochrome [Rhodocyclaceae bacterium]|nr:c-type cytochrome [Rhodocyclaceae bacterium]MCP5241278.1 c-type cytochrome [Zoogloeaceae bacterium]MCB1910564.1 c-type cytochrome [Rhodocyclaceae bacterium]MCP5255181.1 c-type cytochrome [Zoogloeaceae bacterium]MCP5294203.1 c-type cytochrome [Zoogloeaceae bacterium]
MRNIRSILAAAALASAAGSAVAADPANDAAMKKLASSSGCLTCHSIESGKPGPEGMAPIGPAWEDVGKQYAGKPGATEFLTRIVLEGSSPYSSHWKGKVSGLSMPPNAVAITEGNARLLVSWILALGR